MKAEQLISKKVKHCQVKGKLLFDLASLKEHFDGLLIHKTDVIVAEEGELVKEYIKHGDVNFDNAIAKEVAFVPEEEIPKIVVVVVTEETLEDNPELVSEGVLVGETITVDAVETIEEIVPVKTAKKKNNKKQ